MDECKIHLKGLEQNSKSVKDTTELSVPWGFSLNFHIFNSLDSSLRDPAG